VKSDEASTRRIEGLPKRSYLAVLAIQLVVLCCLSPLTFADGSVPAGQKAVALIADKDPELCQQALQMAASLVHSEGNVCAFPVSLTGSQVEPVQWRQVSVEDAKPILSWYLPRLGWDTRLSWKALKPELQGAPYDTFAEEYWRHFGQAMLAAFGEGRGTVEIATIDVDNDGTKETVYRSTILKPHANDDPGLGFSPLQCSFDGQTPVRTYQGILFSEPLRERMGQLTIFDVADNSNLMTYRGSTYWIRHTAGSLTISAIAFKRGHVTLSQRCDIVTQ
jgi:hypothetical protein